MPELMWLYLTVRLSGETSARCVAKAPEAGVGAEVSAFSGAWSGRWDGGLEHRLVVEDIDPPTARVINAWGSRAGRSGWTRVRGEFIQGTLTLPLPRPATVTYRRQPHGTLDATYEWGAGPEHR